MKGKNSLLHWNMQQKQQEKTKIDPEKLGELAEKPEEDQKFCF